jgi:RNA polymerase sigma-70 factor (ECF subfamily)
MQDVSTVPEPLLPRIARGEADAVEACLKRYAPLVWSLAKRLTRDPSALEELVQEIFIDVWKSAARFDAAKASEATFIALIARRRVIDRQRQSGRVRDTAELDDAQLGALDDNFAQLEIRDDARRAHAALQQLKPEQRRLILLSVVDGLTHQEIATASGLPLGTIKSHIRRGLDRAAEILRGGTRQEDT